MKPKSHQEVPIICPMCEQPVFARRERIELHRQIYVFGECPASNKTIAEAQALQALKVVKEKIHGTG